MGIKSNCMDTSNNKYVILQDQEIAKKENLKR